MNIAVIKLGARLADAGTSGGSGEALAILKMLVDGGAEVHAYSKFLKKDSSIPGVIKHQIIEYKNNSIPNNHDALVVINGNINFFGGEEDTEQILNYKFINKFKGPIFYAMCDPNLTLKQIWSSIQKKEWSSNWNREDIEIIRKDIVYLSQPYDLKAVKDLIKNIKIEIADVQHFPFHLFPLMHEPDFRSGEQIVDLIYGGTFRGGKREAKMIKYYFGHQSISSEMFGKIELKHFKKMLPEEQPTFGKAVQYNQFTEKMKEGLATCIIGDKWYEGRDINQRIYEGILAGVITFIDLEFDPERKVFAKNKKLQNFLYVSSRQELEEKIIMLKNKIERKNTKSIDISKEDYYMNGDVALKLLQKMQYDAVKIDWEKYCKSFADKIFEQINK